MPVSPYRAMAIVYYLRNKKRFNLKQCHLDYMQQLYMSVCVQLLNDSVAMNKNIPKPLSLIYIAIRQTDIPRYQDLKDFIMIMPIIASVSKINDISNGIFSSDVDINNFI